MKSGDIIKYVGIAVAIYLVYRYFSESGLFTGLNAPAQPAPAPQPSATVVAPNPQKVSVTAESLTSAAKASMGASWDGKLTISQWNWFTSKITGTDQQTDLSFGVDVPEPVTVQDYMARRVKAGISGIDFSGLAKLLPPVNSWAM